MINYKLDVVEYPVCEQLTKVNDYNNTVCSECGAKLKIEIEEIITVVENEEKQNVK